MLEVQVLAEDCLSMATGAFGVLWVVIVIVMVIRPGSTTGS